MIKCDAACTKHVSQSLVQRKHNEMKVNGNAGDGGGGDGAGGDDGDDNNNNDIMSTEDFRKLFWGIFNSVILNLIFLIYFTI